MDEKDDIMKDLNQDEEIHDTKEEVNDIAEDLDYNIADVMLEVQGIKEQLNSALEAISEQRAWMEDIIKGSDTVIDEKVGEVNDDDYDEVSEADKNWYHKQQLYLK